MFIRSLLLSAVLFAGASIASAQMKVAIINLQKAVLDTAELTKAQKELEAKFKPRQDQMEAIQKELQQIQTQLQTMQGKLTPAAEQELTVRGQRRQRELQRMTEDLQGDVDRERQDVLQRSAKRMEEVVKKVSEAGGYDVVIDVSNAVFFKPALEITKTATEEYNKAYPVQ
jgi:outer membrane protein